MSLVPSSLRWRITVAAVMIVGLVLALAAVLVFAVQRGQLIQSIDNSLDREAGEIVGLLDDDRVLGDRSDDRFAQIVTDHSTIVAATSDVLRQTAVLDVASAGLDEDGFRFLSASDLPIEDDEYRVLVRRASVQGGDVFVVVGENTDDLRDGLRTLAVSLAIAVPLATALLGAVAWALVGRTLAPVAAIQREVSRIDGARLGERVPVPETRDEIAALAGTMNAMLDRIDHAQERQQNFVADASHELRSPLTRLRASLEADLVSTDRDLNVTGTELLEDVDDLQTLVDDLLFLAKTGHGPTLDHRPVDLDAVVDRVADQLSAGARVPIDTRRVEAVEVIGNERHLTRLLTNMLSNAIRHADRQVWIVTNQSNGSARLEVHDDGPGVPLEDRARIFERFTRVDESRTAATGGAGLGLAIARDIVEAHAGSIEVASSDHGGAVFIIELPLLGLEH